MVEKKIKNSVLRLEKGDVTDIEIDAFVYYARSDLDIGSGYGTAILVRGGLEVKKDLETKGPVADGESVVSTAGMMKAKYIIHSVGPKFQEQNTEEKLRKTMKSALRAADEKGIERVAFPPMGSGFYGIPPDLCAQVMVSTIKEHLGNNTKIKEVVIVPLHMRDFTPLKAQFEALG